MFSDFTYDSTKQEVRGKADEEGSERLSDCAETIESLQQAGGSDQLSGVSVRTPLLVSQGEPVWPGGHRQVGEDHSLRAQEGAPQPGTQKPLWSDEQLREKLAGLSKQKKLKKGPRRKSYEELNGGANERFSEEFNQEFEMPVEVKVEINEGIAGEVKEEIKEEITLEAEDESTYEFVNQSDPLSSS